MITVLLVDDQELVRAGLIALLTRDGDIEVIGEADSGSLGLSMARQYRPDVVLMDIRMPGMDGLEATRQVISDPVLSDVRVVMLTTFDEDEHVMEAIRIGAAGYLLKDIRPDDLRNAVRVVAAGDALLSPSITRKVMRSLADNSGGDVRPELIKELTDREREVLTRVGLGEPNDAVGRALFISPATARTYVSRLLAKLNARDRSQLVVLAYESGLVQPGRGPDVS